MPGSDVSITSSPRSAQLVIENRPDELVRVSEWLAGLVGAWGVAPAPAFAMDLIITEAVTNIIQFGFEGEDRRPISICLQDCPGDLVVHILDGGEGFNPLAAPPMELGRDLDSASVGGRGIHLIKSYADRHHYDRVAGINRLTLAVRKDG